MTTQVRYTPPTIPLGLPHVVQYVTGSLLHLPGAFQLMADRMSRYANADGEVSIALEFLCTISDLGSKNTAKGYIDKLTAMGMLETSHGQGGHDRRSNTYRFLGDLRNWRPLPGEEPGTDPWLALLEVRVENETLRQQVRALAERLDLQTGDVAIGHPPVADGDGVEDLDSDETLAHQRSSGPVGHPNVTDGDGGGADVPDSYETPAHQGSGGPVGHPNVTDGEPPAATETTSHSYETPGSGEPTGENASIGHPNVTDGKPPAAAETASHSYETPGSGEPTGENAPIGHSQVTNGPTEGQQYLERRARVELLVSEFRDHFAKTFTRRGIAGAVHYFSESGEREAELRAQVETLRNEALAAAATPPPETERLTPSGRSGIESCPECGTPFPTYSGAEYCPECTDRRKREGGG